MWYGQHDKQQVRTHTINIVLGNDICGTCQSVYTKYGCLDRFDLYQNLL